MARQYPLTRCFGRIVIDKAWPIGGFCFNVHDENCKYSCTALKLTQALHLSGLRDRKTALRSSCWAQSPHSLQLGLGTAKTGRMLCALLSLRLVRFYDRARTPELKICVMVTEPWSYWFYWLALIDNRRTKSTSRRDIAIPYGITIGGISRILKPQLGLFYHCLLVIVRDRHRRASLSLFITRGCRCMVVWTP